MKATDQALSDAEREAKLENPVATTIPLTWMKFHSWK